MRSTHHLEVSPMNVRVTYLPHQGGYRLIATINDRDWPFFGKNLEQVHRLAQQVLATQGYQLRVHGID